MMITGWQPDSYLTGALVTVDVLGGDRAGHAYGPPPGLPADIARWQQARDTIYRQIMRRSWSDVRQAFVQHQDGDVLDAAVLMMPLAKFIAPPTFDAESGIVCRSGTPIAARDLAAVEWRAS
jgi:hypothetical protein